jgi:hypothetical protein
LAVPKRFSTRDDDEAPEDISDDDVFLKLLKGSRDRALGFFEILEFCRANNGSEADVKFMERLSQLHWSKVVELIGERREQDHARSQPPRVMAAAGKG